MADSTPSRRSLTAIALIVGGALLALAAALGLAGSPGPEIARILRILADLVVAAAFVLLAFGAVALPARIALGIAAAGWLLFAVGELAGLPGGVGTVAQLAAGGGALVGAILLRAAGWATPRVALVFLIATAVYAVLILFRILGVDLQGVGLLLELLFAAGLVVTGALLLRPRAAV